MAAPDRACPDYPGECMHPWAHARTYTEVKATQDATGPAACTCPTGPTTIARIVAQRLVTIEHRHHPLACGLPSTWTRPADYQADTRVRAPRGGRR